MATLLQGTKFTNKSQYMHQNLDTTAASVARENLATVEWRTSVTQHQAPLEEHSKFSRNKSEASFYFQNMHTKTELISMQESICANQK